MKRAIVIKNPSTKNIVQGVKKSVKDTNTAWYKIMKKKHIT